jgi:putative addiction module killer protein
MCHRWHTNKRPERVTAFSLTLKKTDEFLSWYDTLSAIHQVRIDARPERVKNLHFGMSRSLGEGLFELKWKNGLRVYYSRKRIAGIDIVVLWGGFKNTQNADIARSYRLKMRCEHEFQSEAN